MAANETNATSLKDASRISEGDSIVLGGETSKSKARQAVGKTNS